MLLIGLTGNIAAGKSTVAGYFRERGVPLVDSDVAARAAVAPGTPALAAITSRFGRELIAPDGTLDRSTLGRLVFGNVEARRDLEAIVHPAVEAARLLALDSARRSGAVIAVCDIPLLFEARLAWQFPRIIIVDAAESTRIARLVHDRGMLPDDAAARVRAQMPSALKRPRSDLVLDNDDSRDALLQQLDAQWVRITQWHTGAVDDYTS